MLVNLTPHFINVFDENDKVIKWVKPEETSARCSVNREVIGSIDGIPLFDTVFGIIKGLPKPKKGTWYIVSRVVAEASKRNDLIIPDDTIRDKDGIILGCRGFAKVH